jgi:hypothetical protein
VKPKRIKWVGDTECMKELRQAEKFKPEYLKGRHNLGDLGAGGRTNKIYRNK